MKNLQRLTYWTLLTIGTHIGHSIFNLCFFSAWAAYICLKPYNIILINLYKSVILARTGFLTLAAVCQNRAPIWFVDLDPINRNYEKYTASICGEFNWQGRWSTGIISNFETFGALISELRNKPRVWHNARQKWFVGDLNYWIQSRVSWPRYLFTQSVHTTYPPVREAFYLGIPCFGVVDTNAYSNTVSIAFPGNDDSLICLAFYNELVANYILKRKFEIILLWFYNILNRDIIKSMNFYTDKKFNDFNLNLPEMLDFHKHELFNIEGVAEYTFSENINNLFNYDFFLKKNGFFFKKMTINFNLYFFNNKKSGNGHRIYSLNRFFMRRCWLNKYFKESARADSYNQRFPYVPKRKYKEGVAKYRFNYDPLFTKYLSYYISTRFSQYKAIPSYNISSGDDIYYFSKISEFLGFPLLSRKPTFYFNLFFNKWSNSNLFFYDIKKYNASYSSIKLFKSKFIESFKQYNNIKLIFLNLFNVNDLSKFNINDWHLLTKEEYIYILTELNYILSNSLKEDLYKNSKIFEFLIKSFVFYDSLTKCFVVNINFLSKIKYVLNEFFNFAGKKLISIIKLKQDANPEMLYKYIGRRFTKNYFKFWKYKMGHASWFFIRARKWRRNYSLYYRKWYAKRINKKINFKINLLYDIKQSILKIFFSNNNYKNADNLFFLLVKNRLLFLKKIKKLVYFLKKNLIFFYDVFPENNHNYDKKEVLLLFFYLNTVVDYNKEHLSIINNLKNINYQNNLLMTNKLSHIGSGMNDVCNSLVDLMHNSKGSGFHITWDDFSELNYMRKLDYKVWSYLRFVKWDTVFLKRYDVSVLHSLKTKKISSLYGWRFFTLTKSYDK